MAPELVDVVETLTPEMEPVCLGLPIRIETRLLDEVREQGCDFSLASVQVGRPCPVVLPTESWEFADCFQESFKRVELVSDGEEPLPKVLVQERLDQLHI
jgi:hypothetical protein